MSIVNISIVPYSQFAGSEEAYFAYLRTCENVSKVGGLLSGSLETVVDGVSDVGCGTSKCCRSQLCRWVRGENGCTGGRVVDRPLQVDDVAGGNEPCGLHGQSRSVCDGVSIADNLHGGRRDSGDILLVGQQEGVAEVVGSVGAAMSGLGTRGKHYLKNKAKREAARAKRNSGCPSLSASVKTVDTRTAEEIEAVRTLAARRVVENEVAKKMAELRLASLNNKDKTSAVLRLEAARMEQRINDAKARSQASFKKCDQSLKSLGSTGSAGEYALKQEVKKGKDAEVKLEYSQRQLRMFYEHATPDVRQMVANIPEPTFESYIDVFGDCPSEFDEEEAQAYYDDLSLRTAEAGLI